MPTINKPTFTFSTIADKFTFTFSFTATCINCNQVITQQDFAYSNFFFNFPDCTFQHKSCPTIKANPNPQCHSNWTRDLCQT